MLKVGVKLPLNSLFIYVEKVLFNIAGNLPSWIKTIRHILDIIDELNNFDLSTNLLLFVFDIADMFSSIENDSGLESVSYILINLFPPNCFILEAFEICLSCNSSIFDNLFLIPYK